ncbi:MAG: biotin--protein ligase [Mailhella sp.]|nr:biotin--protein ligase [Mailhella sp.]
MIGILWDASHVWGYLLLHAVRSAGISFRILRAPEIAQSGLSCKMFIVPGGPARRKMQALGQNGLTAVRSFVERGGKYLGFCGGAGLALADGIGLCSWKRENLTDRLQHLVSGSLECRIEAGHPLVPDSIAGQSALLPVWWPGRFDEPQEQGNARVLARYHAPGSDLYVADLPYASMPEEILAEWKDMYGVTLRPSLLDGMPCIVAGTRGMGEWLLSYSHLETPEEGPCKTAAGTWFLHLLRTWSGQEPAVKMIPPLNPDAMPVLWEDDALSHARRELEALLDLGRELGLLFPRRSWLLGWRSGVPGPQLNSLRLALAMTPSLTPDDRRIDTWNRNREEFRRMSTLFFQGARSWLLARRLADTLADSAPGMLPRELLFGQKQSLFGSPMNGGGLCGQLLDMLEQAL